MRMPDILSVPGPTFWFDMDGVLCVFEEHVPKETVLDPERHYFRTCPEDPAALAAIRALHAMGPDACQARVLTRLFKDQPEGTKMVQSLDKLRWCQERLPWIRSDRSLFACTDGSKSLVLERVDPGARGRQILIDDDPEQLDSWVKAGGRGLQYVQEGHMMKPWGGPSVKQADGPWAMLSAICKTAAAL